MATGFDDAAIRQKADQVLAGLFERTAAEAQRIFDAVFKAYRGKRAEETQAALKTALRDRGVRLSEQHLAHAAAAITAGRQIALADEDIRVEPVSRRNVAVPGPTVDVLFTASTKRQEMRVHCVDTETDEIGVVAIDYPRTGPHMVVHPATKGETHAREYEASTLGKITLLDLVCPAPE